MVVGADAHVPTRVADGWEMAYDVLEAAGYDTVSFFLDRRRADVPIAEARAGLIAARFSGPVSRRAEWRAGPIRSMMRSVV